jgi:hypothetical protein
VWPKNTKKRQRPTIIEVKIHRKLNISNMDLKNMGELTCMCSGQKSSSNDNSLNRQPLYEKYRTFQ